MAAEITCTAALADDDLVRCVAQTTDSLEAVAQIASRSGAMPKLWV